MEQTLTYKKMKTDPGIVMPLWFIKYTRYEFWPIWLFYFPVIFYWMYLAIRSRSVTYFTAANPGIELGGFCGESKINILNKITPEYLPVTLFFQKDTSFENCLDVLSQHHVLFPVICKPNVGERGNDVEKIENAGQLKSYLDERSFDFIIQEYIDYEVELGILYFRYPDGSKTGITSIVKKEFLSVTGDDVSTISELIAQNTRGRFQAEKLKLKLGAGINTILPAGKKMLLEPIGNHCRGTKFLNGNDLINTQLVYVFDNISKNMEGFYFGRFDLRVKSLDDLYNGKNIRIMEVNGTTSEPAHIYDPNHKLLSAYGAICHNMKLVSIIARQNHKKGITYTPFREFYRIVKNHLYPAKK